MTKQTEASAIQAPVIPGLRAPNRPRLGQNSETKPTFRKRLTVICTDSLVFPFSEFL